MIIYMSKIQQLKSKGFTIIELLIVIVVIGILSALVLNSVVGVQQGGRDRERQTDMNALYVHLEAYHNDNNGYPLLATLTAADNTLQSTFKGADLGLFKAPGQTTNSVSSTTTPTKDQYGYTPLLSDGSTTCVTAPCAKYKIYFYQEKTSTTVTKLSLN